ncbi:hypothetical protein DFH09DRAFT_1370923, partial [Mycena vulgaris]
MRTVLLFVTTLAATAYAIPLTPVVAAIARAPSGELAVEEMRAIHKPQAADASLSVGYTSQPGNSISYTFHAAVCLVRHFQRHSPIHCVRTNPPGGYHVRMNGTIFNAGSPLSNVTARSPTFNATLQPSFQCETPTFTPVHSLSDPGYTPLRLISPAAGDMFSKRSSTALWMELMGLCRPQTFPSCRTTELNLTVELVNTAMGFNPGPQIPTGLDLLDDYLIDT